MPLVLTRIDELLRQQDHDALLEDDECYFLREYTARAGFAASETNGLISNLKKSMDRRGRPEWYYKGAAIEQCARELRATLGLTNAAGAVLIPMPPSKVPGDPAYDDRIVQVVTKACDGTPAIPRELLRMRQSMDAFHTGSGYRSLSDLLDNMYVDETTMHATPAAPRVLAVVDDVITSGKHFRAARTRLAEKYPTTKIVGIFVARRIQPPEE